MSRYTAVLLTFLSGAASADVLDHQSGLLERLLHQLFAAHHLPYTVLVVAAGVVLIRRMVLGKRRSPAKLRRH